MRLSKTLAALPLLLIGTSAGAQMMGQTRTTLLNGDFKALKGEAEVDVVFVYDGMLVGNGLTNEQYVTKKTGELNKRRLAAATSGPVIGSATAPSCTIPSSSNCTTR